jgi:hypothetical protein
VGDLFLVVECWSGTFIHVFLPKHAALDDAQMVTEELFN